MKFKKFGCVILIISVSVVVLIVAFCIGRAILKQDDIPFMSDYGLDFSTNSGSEARERLGSPDSILEYPEEEHIYYTYFKPVFGKDAKVKLVTNMHTDYFSQVLVTWQFDSEQDADEWYEDVKHQISKDYYVPWIFREEGENSMLDGSKSWACSFGALYFYVHNRGTEVTYSAIDF